MFSVKIPEKAISFTGSQFQSENGRGRKSEMLEQKRISELAERSDF